MNTFYIVRHGETENNKAKRLSGWVDTPLTENGLEPTRKVIQKLSKIKFDEIYSSDLGRAYSTAVFVAEGLNYNREIIKTFGLREVNYGDAGNLPSEEAYKTYPGLDSDTHYCPPNGESLDQMQQRVFKTIQDIDEKNQDANIMLVCHSGVMAAINSHHLGADFGQHNISEAYPHDYVGKFTFANGEVTSFEEFPTTSQPSQV